MSESYRVVPSDTHESYRVSESYPPIGGTHSLRRVGTSSTRTQWQLRETFRAKVPGRMDTHRRTKRDPAGNLWRRVHPRGMPVRSDRWRDL